MSRNVRHIVFIPLKVRDLHELDIEEGIACVNILHRHETHQPLCPHAHAGHGRLGKRVSARDSFLLPLVWSTTLFCKYKKILTQALVVHTI